MTMSKKKNIPDLILIGGSLQYIILILIAMLFYPGGSHLDVNHEGYAFFGNFFSDLGRTVAINGDSNPIASIMYYITTIVYGLSLIFFSVFLPQKVPNSNNHSWIKIGSLATLVFGAVAGLGTLLYAVTPLNLYQTIHEFGAGVGYIGTVLFLFGFAGVQLGNPKNRNDHSKAGLFPLLVGGYLLLTILIGNFTDSVFVEMVMQKSGKFLTQLCLIVEGITWQRKHKDVNTS
ncbi:hypothetical protein WKT22_04534 [Candidatus Lokiarchaeum ossiferum]